MNCKQLIEFLDDYLADKLPSEVLREFNRHLSLCPYCVDYLQTYKQAIDMGKQVLRPSAEEIPVDVPPELIQAILAARGKNPGQSNTG